MNKDRILNDIIDIEVEEKFFDGLLEYMGIDLFLNNDWHINLEDFEDNSFLFISMLGYDRYKIIKQYLSLEMKRYIRLHK